MFSPKHNFNEKIKLTLNYNLARNTKVQYIYIKMVSLMIEDNYFKHPNIIKTNRVSFAKQNLNMDFIKYQRVSEEEKEESKHSFSGVNSSWNAKSKSSSKDSNILGGISMQAKATRDKLKPFMYRKKPLGNLEWRGIVADHDNNKYLGQWNKLTNTKEGIGILVCNNGSIYEGNWRNNMTNGKGRYIYSWGDYYDGDWVDGNKHGKGMYYLKIDSKLIFIYK